ncbi:preprotein translocase subunit SecG [Kosmotoga olearia]|uniref:Protein-export membrane protein SecG n=1 Tax=Kosmotoga olearia (strain ATCC BAA-1733 / DSM 21960 / TBF 19.5.1) TaxID=521045 RepID=C5CEE9_KOSOT|nr:preprotein translocase subunit SecG [Kosmotoga olearia]ACR80189.1 preprotein translocase, SecG subunit [Kosmotoga olearia TBF 19.5.1]
MIALSYVLIGVHVVLSVLLTFFVLSQMSKSSELGAAFGSGASHTMFGRKKGLDTAGKITLGLSIAFMVNSVILTFVISKAFPS